MLVYNVMTKEDLSIQNIFSSNKILWIAILTMQYMISKHIKKQNKTKNSINTITVARYQLG